jgi:hypothetical protein
MGKTFSRFGKFSVINFIEYIMYPFGWHLFSFFNTYESEVWSFDEVAEFLHIPFTALELSKISSGFF